MDFVNFKKDLERVVVFSDWKGKHQSFILSHFFVQLNSNLETKSDWEIGYFDVKENKTTVFGLDESKSFVLKTTDEIMQGKEPVEELNLDEIKIEFGEAKERVKTFLPKVFPELINLLGDGFCILQKFKGKTLWNFSFITKKLSMANIKLSAIDGEIISHEEVKFTSK
jgi:hypothetical protein